MLEYHWNIHVLQNVERTEEGRKRRKQSRRESSSFFKLFNVLWSGSIKAPLLLFLLLLFPFSSFLSLFFSFMIIIPTFSEELFMSYFSTAAAATTAVCVCECTFRYVVELIYSVLISPDIAFPPNKLCRRHLFRIKRKRRRRRREILEAAWDALNFFFMTNRFLFHFSGERWKEDFWTVIWNEKREIEVERRNYVFHVACMRQWILFEISH